MEPQDNQPALDSSVCRLPSQEDQENAPSCKYCCTMANLRIEKKIGQGQFSEVYKATYLLEGKLVALKKVQMFEMMDAKSRQDCIKEIDLLKLKHLVSMCISPDPDQRPDIVFVLQIAEQLHMWTFAT
ncbi:unnamed protein product [Menidia menidia]|uniref:NEK6-subfamily protein kinase n=1 Tax=Menidia menidia TaxID=238744 RepID=A0A8S4AFR4_9TELE|nr:unnamed protein product [Menidia menidia]